MITSSPTSIFDNRAQILPRPRSEGSSRSPRCGTRVRRCAACRSMPSTRRRTSSSCQVSCWSPPGVPSAVTAPAASTSMVGSAWSAGACRGWSLDGEASSSQVICRRVPRQNPSSGMVGDDCSQPPLGVAATMLPQRSTTSRWQVSPRVAPSGRGIASPPLTTVPSARRSGAGARAHPTPARNSAEARSPISARRSREVGGVEQPSEVGTVAVVRVAIGERQLGRLQDAVGALGARGSRSSKPSRMPSACSMDGPCVQAPGFATVTPRNSTVSGAS